MDDEKQAAPKDRCFYSIPKDESQSFGRFADAKDSKDALIRYISENIIGNDKIFSGPYGLRKITYLDFIASGRAVKFIEDYIQNEVLPDYGNTHTTTTITSLQTTLYRHEARDIVRNAVHASEHDSVIFCGSGCTAAVHKLIHALDLKQKPVVFVSPYEHHSTLLPWKEVGAKVIRIKEDKNGQVNMDELQRKLKKWQLSGRQMIGCFSAASNITGILVDVDAVTICLHKHGALAFWDYATAAPYVKIDMNPVLTNEDQAFVYKDAIFMSTHKFIGGVSTPGILIAKKTLFKNKIPDKCGGGSVFFVRRDGIRYLQEPEMKEEGGTPAIVESIRAGLVFQLKEAVSAEAIMERERQLYRTARDAWRDCKNLVLLGNLDDVDRLPIFSFLVLHPSSRRFLHYNFVACLLNDLFGIQARGGCACAGPYAMDMLGLDEVTALKIEELLAEDNRLDRTHLRRYREYSPREIIRPGFVRINLPYFMTEDTLQFVVQAVKLVAENGWKLLPQYMFNPETGEWRQKKFQVFKDRKWLGHISYRSGEMKYNIPPHVCKGPVPEDYQDCLNKAAALFQQAEKTKFQLPDHTQMFDHQSQQYRWFLLPSEAALHLSNSQSSPTSFVLPFCPPHFREQVGLPVFVPGGQESDDEILVQESSPCDIADFGEQGTKIMTHDSVDSISELPPFCLGMTSCLDQGFVSDTPAPDVDSAGDGGECFHEVLSENVNKSTSIAKQILKFDSLTKERPAISTELEDKPCEGKSLTMTEVSNAGNPSSCDELVVNGTSVKSDSEKCSEGTSISQCAGTLCSDRVASKHRACEESLETNNDENGESVASSKRRKLEVCQTGVCPQNSSLSNIKHQADNSNQSDSSKNEFKAGKKSRKKSGWFSPPKCIFTQFLKGVEDYNMIQNGDKILVCLSGGKDSLSLLHTVRQYQFYSNSKGIKFEFGAVTVDPQTLSYDPSPLKEYLASLGVPYFYESQCIMEQAKNLNYECASICSFCSRMKRGRIYASARREGYNVLALGQHLDDLCESFIMSIFHNGLLRTMKAHYTVQEGDLRVIRPFVYVREKDLRSFAEQNKLPVIAENCPACFESPKERHRTKQLLASQEILFPQLYSSMMAALKPIMAVSKTGVDIRKLLRQGQSENDDDDLDI